MVELDSFYNDGFGWVCRNCSVGISPGPTGSHSRMFTEGEAESKGPKLANFALAKWADAAREHLMCPRCGITEKLDKR